MFPQRFHLRKLLLLKRLRCSEIRRIYMCTSLKQVFPFQQNIFPVEMSRIGTCETVQRLPFKGSSLVKKSKEK